MNRLVRCWTMLIAASALGACALGGGAGDANPVLAGPAPAFATTDAADRWIVAGDANRLAERVATVTREGVPALRVASAGQPLLLARPFDAHVLATPYLSWSWNMDDPGDRAHPVGLVVGFAGGRGKAGTAGDLAQRWFGGRLPAHDRVLNITWGQFALERGSLLPPADAGGAASYRPRGGRENAGAWWFETVDLASLYARAWPEDDMAQVRVRFIGIAAVADPEGAPSVVGHVSGILLSR